MNRTTLLQDRRMEKFEELLKRQFRRYRRRYEEDGLEGLVDQRLGKSSARRIAVDEVMCGCSTSTRATMRGGT